MTGLTEPQTHVSCLLHRLSHKGGLVAVCLAGAWARLGRGRILLNTRSRSTSNVVQARVSRWPGERRRWGQGEALAR